MKKTHTIAILLITLCLTACSKENSNEESTSEQLLIDNSPWVFDHYELKEIIMGNNLGKEFLENDVNSTYFGLEFNFYKKGIGTLQYPDKPIVPITWVLSNNTLIATPDPDFDDPAYLKNITVTESQLTFELPYTTFNEDFTEETVHSGIYYFK